ncbi:MAG: 16S rRNA (cytosine(1402)-N(4))-methyltransferase RsmH [Planctomycetota bacterium]
MSEFTIEHVPVLASKLAELVSLPQDAVMVDATIGHGGHGLLFGRFLGPEGVIVGLDCDIKAIRRAQFSLKDLPCKVILRNTNFIHISDVLREEGIETVDFVLADLGISSGQLADSDKGLSFDEDMPLDMRIDERIRRSAADIVNDADEKSLADLIYQYGEERASRRIARFIVEARKREAITTTRQLARIVCRALRREGKWLRKHPATRTFQALRIAVNDELENLKILLARVPGILKPGGQVAIISFHSLEDRIVKNDFRERAKEGVYKLRTKKPVRPSEEEIAANKRSRSAKLRIAEKI